jgi:hypothetical protein
MSAWNNILIVLTVYSQNCFSEHEKLKKRIYSSGNGSRSLWSHRTPSTSSNSNFSKRNEVWKRSVRRMFSGCLFSHLQWYSSRSLLFGFFIKLIRRGGMFTIWIIRLFVYRDDDRLGSTASPSESNGKSHSNVKWTSVTQRILSDPRNEIVRFCVNFFTFINLLSHPI